MGEKKAVRGASSDFMPCFSPGSVAQGSRAVIWQKPSIQMEALDGD